MKVHKLFLFLILLVALPSTLSAHINSKNSVEIESDSVRIEKTTQQAIYLGNVRVKQNDSLLTADKLVVKKNRTGGIEVMIASGKPANFTGNIMEKDQPIFGSANIIYFYPDKQLVELEGQAELQHLQDKFKSPKLSYAMDKQIISANRTENQRPLIIMQPRK